MFLSSLSTDCKQLLVAVWRNKSIAKGEKIQRCVYTVAQNCRMKFRQIFRQYKITDIYLLVDKAETAFSFQVCKKIVL